MLGSPTGLTIKQWLRGPDAWDLGVGFGGFGVGPVFRIHGDYLFGLAQALPNTSDATLDLYIGVGPVVGAWPNGYCGNFNDRRDRYGYNCGDSGMFVGGRVPLGLDLRLKKAPIELGFEIAPGLVVSRYYWSGLLDATLIVRFLFDQK